jgi:hypothetical protein
MLRIRVHDLSPNPQIWRHPRTDERQPKSQTEPAILPWQFPPVPCGARRGHADQAAAPAGALARDANRQNTPTTVSVYLVMNR